jgi:hypothetical protein
MRTKLAAMVCGALVLAATAANAQPPINGHARVQSLSAFGRASGPARAQGTVFHSLAQGTQWFPNPDRGPFAPPCSGASC